MEENKMLWTLAIVGLVLAGLMISYQPSPEAGEAMDSMMEGEAMMETGYVHDGTIVAEKTFVYVTDSNYEYEVTRYPSGVIVTEPVEVDDELTIGVVVDPDNLEFGTIPSGENSGKRIVELSNLEDTQAEVEFVVVGDIEGFVEFSQNNFALQPNEEVSVDVVFKADEAEVKEYVGEIDVIVKREIQ